VAVAVKRKVDELLPVSRFPVLSCARMPRATSASMMVSPREFPWICSIRSGSISTRTGIWNHSFSSRTAGEVQHLSDPEPLEIHRRSVRQARDVIFEIQQEVSLRQVFFLLDAFPVRVELEFEILGSRIACFQDDGGFESDPALHDGDQGFRVDPHAAGIERDVDSGSVVNRVSLRTFS
jgi:hypothetical protein